MVDNKAIYNKNYGHTHKDLIIRQKKNNKPTNTERMGTWTDKIIQNLHTTSGHGLIQFSESVKQHGGHGNIFI